MRIALISAAALLMTALAGGAQENTNNSQAIGNLHPTRESEVMLRRHIEGMRIGKPIYELMTPKLIAAVKPYEDIGKARFARLGAVRQIEFRGRSATGVDTYHVRYENGESEYLIALNADGKIDALVVRPGQ